LSEKEMMKFGRDRELIQLVRDMIGMYNNSTLENKKNVMALSKIKRQIITGEAPKNLDFDSTIFKCVMDASLDLERLEDLMDAGQVTFRVDRFPTTGDGEAFHQVLGTFQDTYLTTLGHHTNKLYNLVLNSIMDLLSSLHEHKTFSGYRENEDAQLEVKPGGKLKFRKR